MKMEQIECSETSANHNQTPGKYTKECKQDSKHGENLKSSISVSSAQQIALCKRAYYPSVCLVGDVV